MQLPQRLRKQITKSNSKTYLGAIEGRLELPGVRQIYVERSLSKVAVVVHSAVRENAAITCDEEEERDRRDKIKHTFQS